MTYPPSEAFGYQFEGGEVPLAILIVSSTGVRFEPLATLNGVADEDQGKVAAYIAGQLRKAADGVEAQIGVLTAVADILNNAGTQLVSTWPEFPGFDDAIADMPAQEANELADVIAKAFGGWAPLDVRYGLAAAVWRAGYRKEAS